MDRLIDWQLGTYNAVLMVNSLKKRTYLFHKAKYSYLTSRIKV